MKTIEFPYYSFNLLLTKTIWPETIGGINETNFTITSKHYYDIPSGNTLYDNNSYFILNKNLLLRYFLYYLDNFKTKLIKNKLFIFYNNNWENIENTKSLRKSLFEENNITVEILDYYGVLSIDGFDFHDDTHIMQVFNGELPENIYIDMIKQSQIYNNILYNVRNRCLI